VEHEGSKGGESRGRLVVERGGEEGEADEADLDARCHWGLLSALIDRIPTNSLENQFTIEKSKINEHSSHAAAAGTPAVTAAWDGGTSTMKTVAHATILRAPVLRL
jgi:hypothetical protein